MELPSLSIPPPSTGPYRILTLDGGGIRGYSSLLILQELLLRFDKELYANNAGESHLPAQVNEAFDCVVGTSTGGLITLMLVKLGMTVEDCIQQYMSLSQRIFGRKRSLIGRIFSKNPYKYSGDNLRDYVVQLLEEGDFPANHRLQQVSTKYNGLPTLSDIRCSVVCRQLEDTLRQEIYRDEVFLCSHKSNFEHCCNPEVADAARATSAAPTYFEPMHFDDINDRMILVDGGYIETNNPSQVALRHHRRSDNEAVVMVNIGTGTDPKQAAGQPKPMTTRLKRRVIRPLKPAPGTQPRWMHYVPPICLQYVHILQDAVGLLTQSERVGTWLDEMAKHHSKGLFKFTRLSADTGIHDIELDDYAMVIDKSAKGIQALTKTYLAKPEVEAKLNEVVAQLVKAHRSKTRANRDAMQAEIDNMGRSPIQRTPASEPDNQVPLLYTQHAVHSVDGANSNNNPGMRGQSIGTSEPGPSLPRTPTQEPIQDNANVQDLDPEADLTQVGAAAIEMPSPSSPTPVPLRSRWEARKAPIEQLRVATFPPRKKLNLEEH